MTIINSYLRESMGYKYLTKFATIYTFMAKYVLFGEKTILNEFLKKKDHEPHHLQKQKCPTLIQVTNNLKKGSMVEVIMEYSHFPVSLRYYYELIL